MSQHRISDNPGKGFHGNVTLPKPEEAKKVPGKPAPSKPDEAEVRAKVYGDMHKRVMSLTGAEPKTAKHFLDSTHGKHLAFVHSDVATRGISDKHVDRKITTSFAVFKKHYKPQLFEGERMTEQYTAASYDAKNDHPSKSKTTFIKGVHGDEAEHVDNIRHAAKNNGGKAISVEHAKKIANHPDYHEHAYKYRHDLSRGGSNGYDNGVKKLAGTHPHYPEKEGSIKESLSDIVKRVISERTAAADKRPILVRNAKGEMVVRMARRRYDIVDSGGEGDHRNGTAEAGIK